MRRLLIIGLALSVAWPLAPAPAADLADQDLPAVGAQAENVLLAGGGTNLTNGVFFPGTAQCSGGECEATFPPLQIEQGTDVEFVNLDWSFVTNGHRILSLKFRKVRKKGRTKRKPFFFSEQVDGPGSTVMKTRHLKPGLYFYKCTTHGSMFGAIEVVD
jgi:hypothetical protein